MSDIVVKLDALAKNMTPSEWVLHGDGKGATFGERISIFRSYRGADAALIVGLVNAWPDIRAELLAARQVCESLHEARFAIPGCGDSGILHMTYAGQAKTFPGIGLLWRALKTWRKFNSTP